MVIDPKRKSFYIWMMEIKEIWDKKEMETRNIQKI